jgi:hypothetical protein
LQLCLAGLEPGDGRPRQISRVGQNALVPAQQGSRRVKRRPERV